MLSQLRQIWAVIQINLLSLKHRRWTSVSGCVAIALAVFVLLGALALDNGFRHELNNSGASDVAVVLRAGAGSEVNSSLDREQQDMLATLVELAGKPGKPAVMSPELYINVDVVKKSSKLKANVSLRGITATALQVRRGVKLAEGRLFQPGSNEIVVGRGVNQEFEGLGLGQQLRLHGTNWTVVGIFEAAGSVFESEVWADLRVVQGLLNQGNTIQTVRIGVGLPDQIAELVAAAKKNPRLTVDIKSEQDYYAAQAKESTDLITLFGKPLAVLMALGALAGALNTMYASVAERGREITTLRILGYGRFSAFAGTLAESLVLAGAGAVIGGVAAFAVFNNMSSSMLGAGLSTVVFKMSLSSTQLIEAAWWAIIIGLAGGIFPAFRASRQALALGIVE
ncbi:ABC transporter permease [Massilia antarctica]|uniref:ABC transporter permease n=1 Tax=Massilia antarctica TaxID=2765360 RepID=UPI00226EB571|nr:ABC transporter permease [Massilia sp. H27-R4]MCY0914515.1 hypothetical protein [Massilia sp. H27-R4]